MRMQNVKMDLYYTCINLMTTVVEEGVDRIGLGGMTRSRF